jgi:hypothetical protein
VESGARRRLSGMVVAGTLAALVLGGIAAANGTRAEQSGIFALLDGTPKIDSKFWTERANGLSVTLNVRQFQPDGKPILAYEIDMQKLMHMVVVRDDFATFAHLHPAFDMKTGTFRQSFTKDPNHRYYVYADTTPQDVGQQVFRFTLDGSDAAASAMRPNDRSEPSVSAGPYTVTLGTTSLPAGSAQRLNVTILKDGKPADDLGAYLGAAAHCVFINTQSLAYIHVHPSVRGAGMVMNMNSDAKMEMSGGPAGPLLEMSLPGLPSGLYKLWVQFRGGDKVYTAPFTLRAR